MGASLYPFLPGNTVSPSADSRGAVVSYWRKYMHKVLVNCLGGLSLPAGPRSAIGRASDS